MSTNRRTPAQIAADDLRAQMERVTVAESRIKTARASVEKAEENRADALRRADYFAMHPDLPGDTLADYQAWKIARETADGSPDEPSPAEEAAWASGAREVLAAVLARFDEESWTGGATIVSGIAEEYGITLDASEVIDAEIVGDDA